MEFITVKTALSPYKKSPYWFEFDNNLNLYRGCCHGCIYCDSRSDCYQIENFDQVKAKADIITILEKELRYKRKKGIVCTGAMSDPYNPYEEQLQLTRRALELFARYGYGVGIFTKSSLILRDIDILKEISKHNPVVCCITVTSAWDELSRVIEPHVSSSSQRFFAVRELSNAGIYTGILMTPMLPFLTDSLENIKKLVMLAKRSGAKFIFPMFGMTLRENQRQYYFQKLEQHFPKLKRKYIETYGNQYYCEALNAKLLKRQFEKDCEEYGLLFQMPDIIKGYKGKDRYCFEQLNLFDYI